MYLQENLGADSLVQYLMIDFPVSYGADQTEGGLIQCVI